MKGRIVPSGRGEEKLTTWLFVSLAVHCAFIVGLFLMPHLPLPSAPPAPVYTVDLVGGEKIGATNLGTQLTPAPEPRANPKTAPEPAPAPETKAPEVKQEPKREKVEKEKPPKPEKAKTQERSAVEEKAPVKEPPKSELPTREKEPVAEKKENAAKEAAKEPQSATRESLDRVRERLIQSALERVRSRTESAQKTAPAGETISAGTGQGEGAAALGEGGRGGGVPKGIEFISYRNKIFSIIQSNWAWPGQRSDLKVTVRFGIRENGEITGLKVVQPSGDSSYDESVLRAVRKSNPLPPPPESYRADFADVELNFLPPNAGK
ncbi:MAG TPA: cell envelope integrity protein TolA [Candidatus Eisenbacteria bacterium]|nr:cell envelope integrity protein TolA [Candidatus Eisenbacteria bacterium]